MKIKERAISFRNQKQRLFGMFHLPDRTLPCSAVVLLHGFTGQRIESHRLFVKQARDLAINGIAALRFDFRGSGESEGDFEQMTVEGEISDAGAALQWLAKNKMVDTQRFGLLGFSLGGAVGASLLGRTEVIQSTVLWAAAPEGERIYHRIADGATPPIDLGGNVVGADFVNGLMQINPFRALPEYRGALCCIHGSEDTVVPPDNSKRYYNSAQMAQPKELIYIQGADHGFSSRQFERQLIAQTTRWFLKTL